MRVTATASDPGAVLRFTLDHSEPTALSPVFEPMDFRAAATLRVRAFGSGVVDTHGALIAIQHDSPGYKWNLGDVPIGGIPPAPLKLRGDAELVKDPVEDRVVRLVSSGKDPADNAAQLAIGRAMRRGRLELTLRFRSSAAATGAMEVSSAFARQAALRFRLEKGAMLVPGSDVRHQLPNDTWIDARIEIDLKNAEWSATLTNDGGPVLSLPRVVSPHRGLSSVDWFGWTMDGKVKSTIEFARFDLRRLDD